MRLWAWVVPFGLQRQCSLSFLTVLIWSFVQSLAIRTDFQLPRHCSPYVKVQNSALPVFASGNREHDVKDGWGVIAFACAGWKQRFFVDPPMWLACGEMSLDRSSPQFLGGESLGALCSELTALAEALLTLRDCDP